MFWDLSRNCCFVEHVNTTNYYYYFEKEPEMAENEL